MFLSLLYCVSPNIFSVSCTSVNSLFVLIYCYRGTLQKSIKLKITRWCSRVSEFYLCLILMSDVFIYDVCRSLVCSSSQTFFTTVALAFHTRLLIVKCTSTPSLTTCCNLWLLIVHYYNCVNMDYLLPTVPVLSEIIYHLFVWWNFLPFVLMIQFMYGLSVSFLCIYLLRLEHN